MQASGKPNFPGQFNEKPTCVGRQWGRGVAEPPRRLSIRKENELCVDSGFRGERAVYQGAAGAFGVCH